MKLQDVILKAMAKRLSWIEAAEIAGMSVRNMQRLRQRYQEFGYRGRFDQRRGKRSVHRIPMETAERVLAALWLNASGIIRTIPLGRGGRDRLPYNPCPSSELERNPNFMAFTRALTEWLEAKRADRLNECGR